MNPQFDHVEGVLKFVNLNFSPGVSQIIIADWNTFPDWEEPMNLLLGISYHPSFTASFFL
jgi:hypothetical protein